MSNTRATLLLRLRDRGDETAWSQFHELYAPLLYAYARQRGLTQADAEEIRDQCLLAVSQKMESFEYSRTKGSFKNWLYCIANGKVIDFLRKRREHEADTNVLRQVPDPHPSPEELWNQHWSHQHILYCASRAKGTFSEKTYRVFEMLAFEGREVDEVCGQLNLTRNQVYIAKSRVMRRIRADVKALGLPL